MDISIPAVCLSRCRHTLSIPFVSDRREPEARGTRLERDEWDVEWREDYVTSILSLGNFRSYSFIPAVEIILDGWK